MRIWMAVALLAASWLPGTGFYRPGWLWWGALVVAGIALLVGRMPGLADRRGAAWAAILLLPAVCVAPGPFRAVPALAAAGLALGLLPPPWAALRALAHSAVCAAAILLAQGLAMLVYMTLTARSHELPWPLTNLVGAVARLQGLPAAQHGACLAVWSMRQLHPFGITWELVLEPTVLCFFVGGGVVLALQAAVHAELADRWARFWRSLGQLAVCVAVWLPIRVALLMGLYLNGVLRTEYEAELNQMPLFWRLGTHLVLLAGPVLLAWRFVEVRGPVGTQAPAPLPTGARWPRAVGLTGAAVLLLTCALWLDLPGPRKAGRVMVDEYHSTWERTDQPFTTDWYGTDSGYNYACIYDYLSRFYDVGRLNEPLTEAALQDVSVLMLKVPTAPYSPEEVETVRRFVARGGGLLLIGEHTDFKGTGRNLNDIARHFGVCFRYDCVFGIPSVFKQHLDPALVPHPVTGYLPAFDFAVSCSLAPRTVRGRALIIGRGRKTLPADYHVSNYYPQAEDRPDMRWATFVQLWTRRYGRGRVVAFTDSTVFSNFSAFEPGKAELMLGMVEWLHRRPPLLDPRPFLALVGLGCLIAAIRAQPAPGLSGLIVLLAAGSLGWALAVPVVRTLHAVGMPTPANLRPYTLVVMERTVSAAKLAESGFTSGEADGFGLFERWILRLGYFTTRREGRAATTGHALICIYPRKAPRPAYVNNLLGYVQAGGRLVVIDSADNQNSTANALLAPFGLAIGQGTSLQGQLRGPAGWPTVPVDKACSVSGGTPFLFVDDKPVATMTQYGQGTVTAIGFGSRFSDANMGVTGDLVPDPAMRQVYELEFTLVRHILEGAASSAPTPAPPPAPPQGAPATVGSAPAASGPRGGP